jgi:beta-lactamase regulating signal transducer with metallopeptidase domain
MIAALSFHEVAQTASGEMVECLVEGTVILLFAALLSRALRRQNSGTRFVVWFSALIGIAIVPLLRIASQAGGSAAAAETSSSAAITLPGSWAFYLFCAWAAIAGVALLRVGAGLWQLYALRRNSAVLDIKNLQPELQKTLAQFARGRGAAIRVSERVHAPTAIGLVSPAVVLPAWLLEELSEAELKQVLLHELAHLRRWDDWSNLVQKVVKAILFFHPAVWWIEQRVSLEREMACDEAVVAETANPRAYAQCLARLAEKSFLRRGMMLAQAAVGRIRQTSLRVARILDGNKPVATRAWKPAFALTALLALAGSASRSQLPTLVAFDDAPSSVQTKPLPAASTKPATIGQFAIGQLTTAAKNVAPVARAAKAQPAHRRARTLAAKIERPPVPAPHPSASIAFLQEQVRYRVIPARLVQPDGSAGIPVFSETVLVFAGNSRDFSFTRAVWTIQVWQVTVPAPNRNSIQQGTPQKEI